jgi:hypothetical protein
VTFDREQNLELILSVQQIAKMEHAVLLHGSFIATVTVLTFSVAGIDMTLGDTAVITGGR